MGTYKRNRTESNIEFLTTGHNLEKAVIKYIMNEKRVPKKWRYMLGQNIINLAAEMMKNIIAANSVYANTPERLLLRTELQNKAITNLRQLEQKMRLLLEIVDSVTAESLREICDLMYSEKEHLQRWKKTNKLVGQAKVSNGEQ